MKQRIIHPGALLGVAHVLQSGHPKMTAEMAVDNAVQIIRGLHEMGLEVGPIAAFGPHEVTQTDAFKMAGDLFDKDLMDRKPWLPQ